MWVYKPWRLGRSPGENGNPLTVIFLVSGQASFGVPKVKQWEGDSGWGAHVNPRLIHVCMAKTTTIL